jgi:hypothetical protein
MAALSKLEQVLHALGSGVGKAKGMTMQELLSAGASKGKALAKDGYATVKAAPKAAAIGAGAGAAGMYGASQMGRESDPDEEELRAMIAAMRRGEM